MATDIAFAIGVMALLGARVPAGLVVFLTALAIVDDIGAVLVIAFFYTEDLNSLSLIFGMGFYALSVLGNALRIRSPMYYLIIGLAVWLSFLQSGIHATIAALLMAFTIPARVVLDLRSFVEAINARLSALRRQFGVLSTGRYPTSEQNHLIEDLEAYIEKAQAPLQRLEHDLAGVVTFLILPIFALANAGVNLGHLPSGAVTDMLTVGVIMGLVLGKPIGITLFSYVAVRLGLADLPRGVTWGHVVGAGILAGIGFTMALFIGKLAFPPGSDVELAKLGVLIGSTVAAIVGLFVLARVSPRT
jgi:NhaA family Na+:H+ antiporter